MNLATEHKHFYKITKGSDRRGMTTGDTHSSGRISDLHQYTLLVETIWFIEHGVFLLYLEGSIEQVQPHRLDSNI